MKGDSHIGGQKNVCAAGTTPQCKSSETEGFFMKFGVTTLNGETVMSVVIIIGKHKKAESESAIENVAEPIGGENDADFSNMFLRQGKMFFRRTYL